jgi:hypothetical protein
VSQEPLADRVLTLIKTTALVAARKEGADREAYLQANKDEYLAYAQQAPGVTAEQARDWAEQMDTWVRAMIEIVIHNEGDPDGVV